MSNPANPLLVATADASGSPAVGMEDFEVVDRSSGEEDAATRQPKRSRKQRKKAGITSVTNKITAKWSEESVQEALDQLEALALEEESKSREVMSFDKA